MCEGPAGKFHGAAAQEEKGLREIYLYMRIINLAKRFTGRCQKTSASL